MIENENTKWALLKAHVECQLRTQMAITPKNLIPRGSYADGCVQMLEEILRMIDFIEGRTITLQSKDSSDLPDRNREL